MQTKRFKTSMPSEPLIKTYSLFFLTRAANPDDQPLSAHRHKTSDGVTIQS